MIKHDIYDEHEGFRLWNYMECETLESGQEVWRITETALIADQLIALEDADPTALPGTELDWRNYRTKVRGWKDGAEGFPDTASRPVRPE